MNLTLKNGLHNRCGSLKKKEQKPRHTVVSAVLLMQWTNEHLRYQVSLAALHMSRVWRGRLS